MHSTPEPSVLLPGVDRNQVGGQLLPGAILEAVKLLGITRPITVSFTAQLRTDGKHIAKRKVKGNLNSPIVHVIRLSTYIKGEALGKTMWHELAHAAQSERFDTLLAWNTVYARDVNARGYRGSLYEQEARAAEDFNDEMPLAKVAA